MNMISIFFDRIIGSQYLAECNSIISYSDETVTIAGTIIPFEKYFPPKKFFHYIVTNKILENGDWFVPCHQLLCNKRILKPELYISKNNKSIINVFSKSRMAPTVANRFHLNVNNFETINPIPLNNNEPFYKKSIEKLIRSDHLTIFNLMK